MLAPLADRFTLIAPVLLGHGGSAKPRADYAAAAYACGMRDLHYVLERYHALGDPTARRRPAERRTTGYVSGVARRLISSGFAMEDAVGYSRAVVDGDWVHVSGTTGFDYATMTIAEGVAEQAEQCLRNIGAALAEAGAEFADIVRVRYLLTDRADFEPCWPALRARFGDVRPAATMQVCGLADPRMLIEIEVTAHRPPPETPATAPES